MLSRLSRNAVKSATIKNSAARCVAGTSRHFVQPSGTNRASVVDVPDMPQREINLIEKTRPIYLDMQVSKLAFY